MNYLNGKYFYSFLLGRIITADSDGLGSPAVDTLAR